MAIGNVLNDRAMVERFHADPVRSRRRSSCSRNRCPRDVLVARPRAEEVKSAADVRRTSSHRSCAGSRRPTTPIPRTHILSNGRYAVMVTAAGFGYSRFRNLAVTRWREDVTRDSSSSLLFLRDMQNRQPGPESGRRCSVRLP